MPELFGVGNEDVYGKIAYCEKGNDRYNKNYAFHNSTSSLGPYLRRQQQKHGVYFKPAQQHGEGQNKL